MKLHLIEKVEIPEGIEATLIGDAHKTLKVKGEKGENERKFILSGITLDKKDNEIIIEAKKATKREKKMMNTVKAHILNMIKGASEGFEYKLKICFSHFPITVEVSGDGQGATIKNFLGEKIDRHVTLPGGVEVKADKEFVTINSPNKELAGQAAANFEKATWVRLKDRRIFQDGIWITEKAGRKI
jgi:large subunit ribosomal protein L6